MQNDIKVEEVVRSESNDENVKVTSSIYIANTFNDFFFVQVGEYLANRIVDTNANDSYKEYLGPHRDETFFLSKTIQYIQYPISNFKTFTDVHKRRYSARTCDHKSTTLH